MPWRSYNALTVNGERKLLSEWMHVFSDSPLSIHKEIADFLKLWMSEIDTVEVLTSGSTGTSKVISMHKSSMIQSAEITLRYFGLEEGMTALLCLPVKYIAGKMMLLRAITGKLNLIICEPDSMPLKNLKENIAFCAMTPYQVQASVTNNPDDFNKVTTLIIGGAEVTPQLESKLKQCDVECFATFGMTETISHIALRKLNHDTEFHALDGVTFWQDERACLIIKAQHLDNDILTNDVVDLIDTKSFKWLGRIDNIINSAGIKIHPEQVEKKLQGLIDRRFFVTGSFDEQFGTAVCLVIEGDPFDASTMSLFESSLKDELDTYELPRSIIFMDQFLETETGKIVKQLD